MNVMHKHDAPVDISNAENMKDDFLPLHVIPDSENPGDKDAYNKALSDKENRHVVKNAKESAEQGRDMQKQQQVDDIGASGCVWLKCVDIHAPSDDRSQEWTEFTCCRCDYKAP